MAYIRTRVHNLGEIRRPVRNNCPSSLIIDGYLCTFLEFILHVFFFISFIFVVKKDP